MTLAVCLCALGVALINNNGFCVVVAASQHLADEVFFTPNLLTLFTFAANFASLGATFLNARVLIKFSASTRIYGVCVALVFGYAILAIASRFHGAAPTCMDPSTPPRHFSHINTRELCERTGHVWTARPNYLVPGAIFVCFFVCIFMCYLTLSFPPNHAHTHALLPLNIAIITT